MAGGVSKVLGVLFLIVGLVLVVGGLGAAYYGDQKERDESESMPVSALRQEERSENRDVVTAGLVGAALGGAFIIVSIVLLLIGGARASYALRKEIAQGKQQQPIVLVQGAGGATVAPVVPEEPVVQRTGGLSARNIGVLAVLCVLLVAGAAYAVLETDSMDSGDDGSNVAADGFLKGDSWEGTLSAGFRDPVGGTAGPTASVSRTFNTPEGTGRADVVLQWTPVENGAERLSFALYAVKDGEARLLQETSGPSALALSGALAAGESLRVVVTQSESGVVAEQGFNVSVAFYT